MDIHVKLQSNISKSNWNFNKLVIATGDRKFFSFGKHAYTLKSPTALFPSRITTQFLGKFLIVSAETVTHQCSWYFSFHACNCEDECWKVFCLFLSKNFFSQNSRDNILDLITLGYHFNSIVHLSMFWLVESRHDKSLEIVYHDQGRFVTANDLVKPHELERGLLCAVAGNAFIPKNPTARIF